MKIADISFKLLILFFLFWFCNSSLALWSIFNILSYFSWFFASLFADSDFVLSVLCYLLPLFSLYLVLFPVYIILSFCICCSLSVTELIFYFVEVCWFVFCCILHYIRLSLPLLQYFFHVWVLVFLLHIFYFIFWCIHGSFANFFILPLILFFFLLVVVVFGGL